MENENKTLVAVQGTAKHTNPIKRFFSSLNAKRKKAALAITTAFAMQVATMMSAFAAPSGGSGGGGTTPDTTAFDGVIDIFIFWIQKIGLVVALVGGVMFGFGFKNEDSDAKSRGVMTLVAGLIVAGVSTIADVLGL